MNRKPIRTRGKVQLSRYFQEFKEGDHVADVAVVKERSLQPSFPNQIQGRTGVVEGKRGKAFMIKMKDMNKEKRYLIEPIHLKKIKISE